MSLTVSCPSVQVYGGWPAVASALAQHPEALGMSWQALGGLLGDPRQRHAWRLAAGMSAAELAPEEDAEQRGRGLLLSLGVAPQATAQDLTAQSWQSLPAFQPPEQAQP